MSGSSDEGFDDRSGEEETRSEAELVALSKQLRQRQQRLRLALLFASLAAVVALAGALSSLNSASTSQAELLGGVGSAAASALVGFLLAAVPRLIARRRAKALERGPHPQVVDLQHRVLMQQLELRYVLMGGVQSRG